MAGLYGPRSSYQRNQKTESGGLWHSRCNSSQPSSLGVGKDITNERDSQWVEDNGTVECKEEDDDLRYVSEYRELETKKILQVNELRRLSQNVSWKGFGDQGSSSLPGSGEDCRNEPPERFYNRFNMNERNVDNGNLIINTCKDKILDAISNHQVTIVEGFTGCGKTTQVPQFLLDEAVKNKRHCKIVVTQPRRIAAVSVASRVCQERGWELGSLVGYQVGMDRKFSEDSRLVYMTTGVLLQMMINRKNFDDWTHIVIDEVHERDLDTDLLMLVIKHIMIELAETRIKVILMSATLNAQKFMDYFPAWCCDGLQPGAALISIPYQTVYPVTEYYIDNLPGINFSREYGTDLGAEPRIEQSVYAVVGEIIVSFDEFETRERKYSGHSHSERNGVTHSLCDRGAVLVFLPGLLEIETLYKVLTDVILEQEKDGNDLKWILLPLHSTITNEEQQKVFLPVAKGCRKIILATNIAESSITVTDIKYVIDFCLTKSLSCDPDTKYTCLRMEWASKNQCVQRRGRCGRVSPGYVYRLVPKLFYDAGLIQEAAPEMKKSSLESVVLHAKMLNMGSPVAILALAIDPPKISGIRRAVANLKEVGALTIDCSEQSGHVRVYNDLDGDLTYLGKIMAKLPIDMRFGRLIMLGHAFNVLEECIIIAAGLSTKSPFSYPYNRRLQAYLSKLYWSQNTFSDCFALVRVYRTWIKKFHGREFRRTSEERSWAKQYLVQLSVMREIQNLVDEIKRRLHSAHVITEDNSDKELTEERALLLKIVIAGAFYPNYFVSSRSQIECKEYEKTIYKDLGGRNPSTTVVFQGFPQAQPTKLYEKHVLKYFDGSTFDGEMLIPYVERQDKSTKLLVSFDSRGQKVGSLSHGLYRAVKMRMLRQIVSFPVLQERDSVAVLDQCLSNLRISDSASRAPLQTSLPNVIDKQTSVIVTFAISPSEFYVVCEVDLPKLRRVEKLLADNSPNFKQARFDRLKRGDLVFVLEENTYYRARVEQIVEDRQRKDALVYYVDRGGITFKKSHQLFWIRGSAVDQLYEIPALAIQCRIKEVTAPAMFASIWPLSSKVLLEKLACAKPVLTFEIFSIVESIMAGDILVPPNNQSFRKLLLDESLAQEAIESRESQDNFGNRISTYVARQEKTVLDHLNENQLTKNVPRPVIPPPECTDEQRPILVNLRGPNTPLELTFIALTRSLSSKQVMVDGASVNSVALDQDYLKPASRLLVAASVGISQRNERAMARDTTMLPPLPGLAGLMTLLFSPVTRLEVNESLTEYTGVLAGLGIDPQTGEPAYSDHDMAVPFDAKIDNRDILLINSIRNTINLTLRSPDPVELRSLRDKAISDTLRLIGRAREQIEELGVLEDWTNFPPGLELIRHAERFDPGDVFQLHDCFKLE